MNKFMNVKNQTETTADIYFYGDIVNDSWLSEWYPDDMCPADVKEVLDEVQGKDLNIYVNSGGGSVFGGMAIYNMLKRHQGKKTVYVDGLAGSIASVIALAGDEVIIPATAYMMIHKPWSGVYGNADDMRKMADDLDRIQEGILNVYKENLRENIEIETIEEMVNAETWLTGEEAAKYFNIKTVETDVLNYSTFDKNNYKNVPKNLLENSNNLEETTKNISNDVQALTDEEEKEIIDLLIMEACR